MPFISSVSVLSCRLPLLFGATFGFLPPEFIQVGFHLLGHFSIQIPVPFPSPPLFAPIILLLSSKRLVMVPSLPHLQADQLTISSLPEVAKLRLPFIVVGLAFSSVFFTCGIECTDAQLFALLLHTPNIHSVNNCVWVEKKVRIPPKYFPPGGS